MAVYDDNNYNIFKDEILKIKEVDINIMNRVLTKEDLIKEVNEKEIDIIILTTDIKGEENLMYLTEEENIPGNIRIIGIDVVGINKLIYGKMHKNGVDFIDLEELELLKELILNIKEDKENEEENESKEHNPTKNKKIKKGRKKEKRNKSSKALRGRFNNLINKKENKENEKNNKAEIKTKEVVRNVETTKHHIIEKVKVKTKVGEDYKKIFAFISPLSVGKTELASNIAVSISKKGKRVALIDLDFNKYGLLYNFNIPQDNNECYFKYRLLLRKIEGYIKGENRDLTEDEMKDLAIYKEKNLYLYTGNQEVPIKDKNIVSNNIIKNTLNNQVIDRLKESNISDKIIDDLFYLYRKEQSAIYSETLNFLIRKLKSFADVIVIDVGSCINRSLLNTILSMDNLEKFLVADQNIQNLNNITDSLKLDHNMDYENWNLVINKYQRIKALKDKEIEEFFLSDVDYQNYGIKRSFKVPYVNDLWEFKSNRKYVYGNNEEFDLSIDRIIDGCYLIEDSEEQNSRLGKFLKKFKREEREI